VCDQVNLSKQDVGFDIDQLELASRIVLSEASDRHRVGSEEDDKESSSRSDSETSSNDDDDSDSSSTSSDSFLAGSSTQLTDHDRLVSVSAVSCSDDGTSHPPATVSDLLVVTENILPAAAAAAVEPAELVCKQLSSLTVSDEQPRVTSVVPEPPESGTDLAAER